MLNETTENGKTYHTQQMITTKISCLKQKDNLNVAYIRASRAAIVREDGTFYAKDKKNRINLKKTNTTNSYSSKNCKNSNTEFAGITITCDSIKLINNDIKIKEKYFAN